MKSRILPILCAALFFLFTACGMQENAHIEEKKPVKIAVIDTGFSGLAIPAENVIEGKNYLEETLSTEDTYGHGTAVASVILENCPDALLIPLVSNAFDHGKMLQVDNDVFARIIRDAVDVYECDIINISAGLILDKNAIREAVAYAEEQNVLIVSSVGNDYASQGEFKYYPAGYESVLAVGSVNKEGSSISEFSQRGSWVDLYACGEDVTISTLSGNTRTSDGTSYSAARVSAYAAKILQEQNKKVAARTLRQLVMDSAEVLSDGSKYLPR